MMPPPTSTTSGELASGVTGRAFLALDNRYFRCSALSASDMPLPRCEESPVGELRHECGPGSAGWRLHGRAGSSLGGRSDGRIVGAFAAGPGRADRGVPLAEQSEPDARPVPDADATPRRRRRTRLLLVLAAAVLALDVVTKLVVVATIQQGENIRTLGG